MHGRVDAWADEPAGRQAGRQRSVLNRCLRALPLSGSCSLLSPKPRPSPREPIANEVGGASWLTASGGVRTSEGPYYLPGAFSSPPGKPEEDSKAQKIQAPVLFDCAIQYT